MVSMRRWGRLLRFFLVMTLVITTAFSTVTQVSTAETAAKKESKVLIAYFGRYGNTNFKKDVDAITSASIVKDGSKSGVQQKCLHA